MCLLQSWDDKGADKASSGEETHDQVWLQEQRYAAWHGN